MKTYAFVVTFNRFELLKRVIECLRSQTYKLEKIVVINNSSTDGTSEWLDQQSDLYVITQDNLGGAGGFHSGVKYCYEDGADWIWMMDDDVFPEKDCLENLLKYGNISPCLNMYRTYSDGITVPWPYWYYQPDAKNSEHYDSRTDCEYVKLIDGVCFEGLLVNRKLVSQLGYPDKDFFVAGDDTTYGYRAAKICTPILVKSARAVRYAKSTDNGLRPLTTYYAIRNRHLIKKYNRMYNLDIPISAKGIYYFYSPIKRIVVYLRDSSDINKKLMKSVLWGILDNIKKLTGSTYFIHKI